MPRGRMLNKTISLDEAVARLSPVSCLIYTWLIAFQDSEGRMIAIPEAIKGTVFPLIKYITLSVIKKSLSEIESFGLIRLYGNNKMYLQFNGFHKNQKIDKTKEAPSSIPTPELLQSNSRVTPDHFPINSEVEVKDKELLTTSALRHTEFELFKTEIQTAWNEFAEFRKLAKIKLIDGEREKNLMRLFKNKSFMQNWKECLEIAHKQNFLFGGNDRGWRMDFDFFINPPGPKRTANWLKILEGKYGHNRKT